jgi:hypothetical protein
MVSASRGSPAGKKQLQGVSFSLLQENTEEGGSFCFFDVFRALLPVPAPCAIKAHIDGSAEKEEVRSSSVFEALRGLLPSCHTAVPKASAQVIEELDQEGPLDQEDTTSSVHRPPHGTVTVIVRKVDGALLFGPANLVPSKSVAALCDEVLAQCQEKNADACQVDLVHATGKLDGSTRLQELQGAGSSTIELTGAVRTSELSEWRRQRFIEAMLAFWRQLRVRPQEILKFPVAFRADRECMLAALRKTGAEGLLEHAHKRLLSDKRFMMEAVGVKGCALRYAAPGLKDDKDLVSVATRQNSAALRYAGESCRPTPPPSKKAGGPVLSISLPRMPLPVASR